MNAPDHFARQMSDLRDRYRQQMPEVRSQLVAACDKHDFARIRELAHKISGSGGLFGFSDLSHRAARVTEACRNGTEGVVLSAAMDLAAELGRMASDD